MEIVCQKLEKIWAKVEKSLSMDFSKIKHSTCSSGHVEGSVVLTTLAKRLSLVVQSITVKRIQTSYRIPKIYARSPRKKQNVVHWKNFSRKFQKKELRVQSLKKFLLLLVQVSSVQKAQQDTQEAIYSTPHREFFPRSRKNFESLQKKLVVENIWLENLKLFFCQHQPKNTQLLRSRAV